MDSLIHICNIFNLMEIVDHMSYICFRGVHWLCQRWLTFVLAGKKVIELKTIMLKAPYVWMAANNCSRFFNLLEFLDVFFFFLFGCFFCVLFMYIVCTPLRFFM